MSNSRPGLGLSFEESMCASGLEVVLCKLDMGEVPCSWSGALGSTIISGLNSGVVRVRLEDGCNVVTEADGDEALDSRS